MAWAAGNFTRANGATGWVDDANNNIGIEATRHDTQDNDFATGIDQCLNKTGQNSMTGDLNVGGNRVTNVASGTAAAPAICAGGDVDTGIFSPAANVWAVATNGTEKARIDADGRLGVGITPSTWGTSAAPVQLKGGFAAMGLNNAGYVAANLYWDGTNWKYTATGAGTLLALEVGDYIFQTTPSGTANATATMSERMRLTQGGLLGLNIASPAYRLQLGDDSAAKPTTNTWTIASDARIKTNIQPYAKGLAEICQVEPITYDYNGKGGMPSGPGGVSIIAQDIQPIFPECVGSYKGKLNANDEEETDILNYNGHAITFALINAVKELNAKVEALEARVAELEA